MIRAPARATALAAALATAHCSSEERWDAEGRVYATVGAPAAKAAASLIERPLDAGDAVYVATFEIPGGFVRQPWGDARAFVEFAPGAGLGDGDEPVFCVEYAVGAEQAVLRACSTLSGGADMIDADLTGGRAYPYWLAELPRALEALDVRRASLEVRRPETAASLDGSPWTLWLVDGSCDRVLAARSAAASCDPAAGADCSWVADATIEVAGAVCRMRSAD